MNQLDCTNHPGIHAKNSCYYCGRPFCAKCMVKHKGKYMCQADFYGSQKAEKQGQHYVSPCRQNDPVEYLQQLPQQQLPTPKSNRDRMPNPTKKPFYKRGWFLALCIVVGIAVLGVCCFILWKYYGAEFVRLPLLERNLAQ